jgi:hypothetical protein
LGAPLQPVGAAFPGDLAGNRAWRSPMRR